MLLSILLQIIASMDCTMYSIVSLFNFACYFFICISAIGMWSNVLIYALVTLYALELSMLAVFYMS